MVFIILAGEFHICNMMSNLYYYNNVTDALKAHLTCSIVKTIDVFRIDDQNAIYFGFTDNNNLILVQMQVDEGKYAYAGYHVEYSLRSDGDWLDESGIVFSNISLYDEKAKPSSEIEYALIINKDNIAVADESYVIVNMNTELNNEDIDIHFVYRYFSD